MGTAQRNQQRENGYFAARAEEIRSLRNLHLVQRIGGEEATTSTRTLTYALVLS